MKASLTGKRSPPLIAGTDEHGEKIAEAAASKGQQPQEHCDGIVGAFKALWKEVVIPQLIPSPLKLRATHILTSCAVCMHDSHDSEPLWIKSAWLTSSAPTFCVWRAA